MLVMMSRHPTKRYRWVKMLPCGLTLILLLLYYTWITWETWITLKRTTHWEYVSPPCQQTEASDAQEEEVTQPSTTNYWVTESIDFYGFSCSFWLLYSCFQSWVSANGVSSLSCNKQQSLSDEPEEPMSPAESEVGTFNFYSSSSLTVHSIIT